MEASKSKSDSLSWRNMSVSDINGVSLLADQVHSALPESDQVYKERLALFPEGCLVLADDSNVICGYTISHPIRHQCPPALGSMLGKISPDANQFYIHDVVVSPSLRGKGMAKEAIDRMLALAEGRGYATACLISVYGTRPFWARFGFVPEAVDEGFREKLKGYGDDAVYMIRRNGQKVIAVGEEK
ncbi:acyl-CoA N-acyltransferase [Cladorrhinum sp. PSN259]|nr:acyl-CoA N-acyltransferase [Cladorrhinum sp. PSN259]